MRIFKATSNAKTQNRVGLAFIEDQLTFAVVSNNNEVLFSEKFNRGNNLVSSLLILKKHIKHNYPCYLVLPYSIAMIKEFNFGETNNEAELNKLIKMNALDFFSYPAADLYYDFEILAGNSRRVRLAASKKEYITNWIKIFRDAQLNLVRISIDSFVLEKFLVANQYLQHAKNYAVVLVFGRYLLQVIISSAIIVFMSSNMICENNFHLEEELTKFLCLYENTKKPKKIDEILVFYDAHLEAKTMWPSPWRVVQYKTLRGFAKQKLPLSNLLTVGVTL